MGFQQDPDLIVWKLHLSSSPRQVYQVLATNEGRAGFWAESAVESDIVDFSVDLRNHTPLRTWDNGYVDN